MATNRQTGRSRSPFTGALLGLLWIVQLVFLSTAVIALSLLIGTLKSSPFTMVSVGEELITLPGLTPTPYITTIAISVLLLLLTCLEIIVYFNTHLTPLLYLYSALFKVLTWSVVVALNAWSISRPWLWDFPKSGVPDVIRFYRIYLWVMLGGGVGVYLFFLLTMAYAISVWRKQRRYLKAYAAVSVMQTGV